MTRCALALAGVLAALALAEVVLRLRTDVADSYCVWWPHLQKIFRPEPGVMPGVGGENRFSINSIGLRGDEPSTEHTFRILAVGGSTTECLYLDQAEAWPQRLQTLLNERFRGERVWVGNAGVSGHNTRDHVVQLRHLLPQLQGVDLVVALVGVNDLSVRLGEGDGYDPRELERPGAEERILRRAFQRLPIERDDRLPVHKRTALWRMLGRIRDRLWPSPLVLDEAGSAILTWRAHRRSAGAWIAQAPDLEVALGEYRRNLRTMIELSRGAGARVLLVTQPAIWTEDLPDEVVPYLWFGGTGEFMVETGCDYYTPAALIAGLAAYNRTTVAVAAETGAGCFDLAPLVPRDLRHFYDDVHFNTRGADVVARALADHLGKGPPFVK